MPLKLKLADRIHKRIVDIRRLKQKEEDQTKKITELENELTTKNDRNAQLHKLFQGTAKIFSKQHNYVDQLKEQLEEESKAKGISEEKAKHLEKDVEIYRNWKNELAKKLTELETITKESEKERDQELKDLKAKIKQLTEVKMAREKSEERLRKQSEEFLKVQQMNQVVYDILGEYSTKTGLLLRSQEIINIIKYLSDFLEEVSKPEKTKLGFYIWIKQNKYNFTPEIIPNITDWEEDYHDSFPSLLKNLVLTNFSDLKTFNNPELLLKEKNQKWGEYWADNSNKKKIFKEMDKLLKWYREDNFFELTKELEKTKTELQKELSWWDKWIEDVNHTISKSRENKETYFVYVQSSPNDSTKWLIREDINENKSKNIKGSKNEIVVSKSYSSTLMSYSKRAFKKTIYEYYRDK